MAQQETNELCLPATNFTSLKCNKHCVVNAVFVGHLTGKCYIWNLSSKDVFYAPCIVVNVLRMVR